MTANQKLAYADCQEQAKFVLDVLRQNAALASLMDSLHELRLPDCYVAGGAIPQIVWNSFHGFELNHGLSDFDVVYFDDCHISAESEALVQSRLAAQFPKSPIRIEAINQARVHLWYEKEFGRPIKPYSCTAEAICSFPTTASASGLTVDRNGAWRLFAPRGLTDMLSAVVRANAIQVTARQYEEKCSRWSKIWPRLTVLPWAERSA